MTRSTVVAALLALSLVGACTGGPKPTPEPAASDAPTSASPAPTAAPASTAAAAPSGPAPSLALPGASTIEAAAKALDEAVSYRFTLVQEQQGLSSESAGVVINGDAPRTRLEQRSGDFVVGTIEIGDRTWLSYGGSAWVRKDEWGGTGGDAGQEWINPVRSVAGGQLSEVDRYLDLGVEVHAGISTRHVQGIAGPLAPASDDQSGDRGGFTGTLDAWISVDDGHLVAARVDGEQSMGAFGDEATSPPPYPIALEVTVEGIDDPANAVDEPPVVDPTPRPTNDPAAAALLDRVGDGLATLDSYVLEIETSMAGVDMLATITVNNRPTRAAMEVIDGFSGIPGMSIIVIGKQAWSRSGDGAWEKAAKGEGPTCGTGGSTSSSDMKPCTFELIAGTGASAPASTGGWTVVATGETIDGIACTHLRSGSGLEQGGLTMPGVSDLWLASDAGYLVRQTFTGPGVTSTIQLTHVDDPANLLEPPTK